MRLIFMGTPEFSVPALRALAEAHEVAAVYSQPPRPAGRGKKPRPSPVQRCAEALGLPVEVPERLRAPEVQARFAAWEADMAVVVAYGLLLPQAVLDAPRHGCVNIHASLLPRWRGAAPIHRAILAGDRESGVSIMQMEAGLDTGPVLLDRRVEIGAVETTGELHDRLALLGAEAITEALARWPLEPRPQPEAGVTYADKIDKAEARIDWSAEAQAVARQINGLSPFPGAWCLAGEERLKLLRARAVAGRGAPGAVLSGLTVACGGGGAVEVLAAQRAGKGAQGVEELLRGWTPPERLT